MAISFPTSLDTLTNPSSTDTLDSPSHSDQHSDLNDTVEALEAKVGADSSAVTSSHDYKINTLETAQPTGDIVGTSDTQTLTNKSLTTPTINQINSSDHLILNPGSNKLVKTEVLRQNDTTNSYIGDSVILTGWGQIYGNNSQAISEAVTFGITFSEIPIITINYAGRHSSALSNLSDIGTTDTGVGATQVATAQAPSTTGFTAVLKSGSINGEAASTWSTYYCVYTWIAIGKL